MKRIIAHSLLLTVLILVLNLSLHTMLAEGDTTWDKYVQLHENKMPFALRPLTNLAIKGAMALTDITPRHAFIVTQYSLIFLLLFSMGLYLKQMGFERKRQIQGIWILALSFPVLCVHFIPNFTWDDIWAFIGLVWMAIFLSKGELWKASLCLAFAALNRENALIAAPVFFFWKPAESRKWSWLIWAALPVFLYLSYRAFRFPAELPGRFSRVPVNFETPDETRQTLYSLYISFGWMWGAAAVSCVRFRNRIREGFSNLSKQLFRSAVIVVGISFLITLVSALVRETRLLFTPFIFVIPLALMMFDEIVQGFKAALLRFGGHRLGGMFLLLFGFVQTTIVLLFPKFSYLPMIDFHRVLFAANLTLMILVIVALRRVSPASPPTPTNAAN